MDWLIAASELQIPLSESLSRALLVSPSFNRTDQIWRYLSRIERITDSEVWNILEAGATNDQVFSTGIGNYNGTPYRKAIIEKAKKWDIQGNFAEHIALLDQADPSKPVNLPKML